MGLKGRLNGLSSGQPSAIRPAFVELVTKPATMPECVIEFESASGGKMRIQRIQWKAAVSSDWTSLLRAWRETSG
jgi:hypothetical protein